MPERHRSSRGKSGKRRGLRIALFAAAVLAIAFGVYLSSLYVQLTEAFTRQDEFIPTRIFSDVTRIAPPASRALVEQRLRSLGYSPSGAGSDTLTFSLHPIDYPQYLLPDNHPTLSSGDRPISLRFDGESKDSALHTVQITGQDAPDVFLEPEPIATLSRAGDNTSRAIRDSLKFREVPAQVWKAIIAVEDQHFLEHSGLDPRGFARAIFVNLKTLSFAQGGSTITQQLVKNLMARRTKNVVQKVNEIFLALLLEVRFSKEEILERYLNEVYLGQVGNLEIHGVAEGARHFFGKRLDELNLGETALMAGLIRGPGFYSPYRYRERAVERQRLILKKMVETGQIAQAEADAAAKEPIRLAPPRSAANKAPYFTDFVKAELIRQLKDKIAEEEISSAGLRVYTTLDMSVSDAAQRAVTVGVAEVEKRFKKGEADGKLEAALAAVDHTTGYIRALVGGRSYSHSTFNRILNMKRQVGSTFKPFVYLAAIGKGADEKGVPYGPGHPAEDAAWTLKYDHGRQEWTPKNYEKEFLGWISYRKALAHSINTITARLGVEVGIPEVIKTARALGIETDLPNVPSLSLGVAELSPVELLRAYATLANRGVQDELTVIRGITKHDGADYARFVYHPAQAYPAGPIDLLTDMLTDVFIDGTAKQAIALGFDRPAAGKTGTTSNHRDSWFAGFVPQLTSVVWVGLDQEAGSEKLKLTGAGAAMPIWVRFMKEALSDEPPVPFAVSPHITTVRIDRHTGMTAQDSCSDDQTTVEKFVIGSEPKESTCSPDWPASVRETKAD